MNRHQKSLLFVMGACLLLSLAYCPLYETILDDREIFKYTGMALLKGQIPYRDFFDHKPPMIYFINCAGFLLGPWGLWTLNTLLALLTTLLFFNLCRRYRLPLPWLLPLLFNLMIRDNLISMGINLTREYTAFFTILFFCVLLGNGRYRYFISGLLTALLFFTQQEQVLLLIPFLIYVFVKDADSVAIRFGWFVIGSLSVTLPLILYFAAHHSLRYFWEDAFRFNFSVYTKQFKSPGDHFRSIKYVLDAGNYEMPFLLAFILGTVALFLRNKRKGLVAASLAALFLTLSPELMGGRSNTPTNPGYFITYFLPLSASICMLLFTVFAFTEERALTDRKAQLPFALLLCCSLTYTALQHGTHLVRKDKDPVLTAPELSWLRQQKPGDYELYVFFNNAYICYYNELKTLAPSRWLYQHFWQQYDRWDNDHRILRSIGEDLLRHQTTYVLMDVATLSGFRDPAGRDWWLSFMQTYYQPVALPGRKDHILWQLKK